MLAESQLIIAIYALTESCKLIVPKIIEWLTLRDNQAKAERAANEAGEDRVRRQFQMEQITTILDNTERILVQVKDVERIRELLHQVYGAREDISKIKDKLDSTGPLSNQMDGIEEMVSRVIDVLNTIATIQGEIRLLINNRGK